MDFGKSFRKSLSIIPCGVYYILVMSQFVHQNIPQVKPVQRIQSHSSERVRMKKYATPPVVTVIDS